MHFLDMFQIIELLHINRINENPYFEPTMKNSRVRVYKGDRHLEEANKRI